MSNNTVIKLPKLEIEQYLQDRHITTSVTENEIVSVIFDLLHQYFADQVSSGLVTGVAMFLLYDALIDQNRRVDSKLTALLEDASELEYHLFSKPDDVHFYIEELKKLVVSFKSK